jgi:hypothetical protein
VTVLVFSAFKRLLAAPWKGSRRRKALVALVATGLLAGASLLAVNHFAHRDPVTGKQEVSRTTYASHDGAYEVTVITYSDGSKREIRPGPKDAPSP